MNARYPAGIFSILAISGAALAEPQLYETGPAEDSSYIRFVNATEKGISVSSGSAKLALSAKAEGRVSRFNPVKAGTKLSATIQSGDKKTSVEVIGKPWEYITIAVLPGGAQVETKLIRETPTDQSAIRSSLALFNLDAKCADAAMQGGAKSATILDKVSPYTVARRLINPVKLSTTVVCGAQSTVVDLSQLQAGERYSIFLLNLNNSQQAFFTRDAN